MWAMRYAGRRESDDREVCAGGDGGAGVGGNEGAGRVSTSVRDGYGGSMRIEGMYYVDCR